MFSSTCPSCGAQVKFKSRFSTTCVCSYCQSLLVRQNNSLAFSGKMAALPEDMTFFQIGTKGEIDNIPFEVIGQLQVHWSVGYWNEWYILEENGTQAWIGEAMGMLTYSHEIEATLEIDIQSIKASQKLNLKGSQFIVKDIKPFTCSGCIGELPFEITKGLEGVAIDLVSYDDSCAYLEVIDNKIRIFQGKYVSMEALQLTNIREIDGW